MASTVSDEAIHLSAMARYGLLRFARNDGRTSMLPRPHIAEQESRHFALLDFLAAFGDALAAVMAVDVLERLVARITHAAMHLHGAVGGLAAQPVRPVIAHGNLVGERVLDLCLRQLVHFPRSLADQQP